MSFTQSILRDGVPLGRAFGIPITVHPSLLPVALLLAIGMARGLDFGWLDLPLALGMVVIVFGSILLHELGHSLVARRYGIETHSINLHLFGGVAKILREPSRPSEELWIAAAGPAVSFALAGLFTLLAIPVGLWSLDSEAGAMAAVPLIGGVTVNLVLGGFNLLPGFPMDGGRLLRAWLWHRWRDFPRATVAAATGGEIVGLALVGLGLVRVLGFGDLGGLFMVLIAFFIRSLARQEKRRAQLAQRAFHGNPFGWPAGGPGTTERSTHPSPGRSVEVVVRYPDGREVVYSRRIS